MGVLRTVPVMEHQKRDCYSLFFIKHIFTIFIVMDDLRQKELIETIYQYLEETFKTYTLGSEYTGPIKYIDVGGKSRLVLNNKKYLVNLLYNNLPDEMKSLDPVIVRRTIKNYIDNILKP